MMPSQFLCSPNAAPRALIWTRSGFTGAMVVHHLETGPSPHSPKPSVYDYVRATSTYTHGVSVTVDSEYDVTGASGIRVATGRGSVATMEAQTRNFQSGAGTIEAFFAQGRLCQLALSSNGDPAITLNESDVLKGVNERCESPSGQLDCPWQCLVWHLFRQPWR